MGTDERRLLETAIEFFERDADEVEEMVEDWGEDTPDEWGVMMGDVPTFDRMAVKALEKQLPGKLAPVRIYRDGHKRNLLRCPCCGKIGATFGTYCPDCGQRLEETGERHG